MSLRERASTLSKNQRAMAGFIKVLAFGVIAGVVIYSDIQFIQVMWKSYPDGIAKIFSLIGAVATGASVMALIGAEAFWFSRGPQMVFGWIFTGLEVGIMACNVILGFELTGGIASLDPFMGAYLWLCPATPIVAALCWIMIFNLDEGQKARHDEREMQDDIAASDREHRMAVHESKMALKRRYLESTTTYLDQIADDPNVQAGLRMGAWKFAGEELRNLTGMYLPLPSQPTASVQPKMVDGSLSPSSDAPKTEPEKKTETVPEPQKQGWFRNPFARKQEPLPVYTTPHQNPEFFENEFRKLQEEMAELRKQRQSESPQSPAETNVSQPAPKRTYPVLPDAPHYADTEPLNPSAQPSSLIDDLVESVGGESASPLSQKASQNGHQ